MNKGEKLISLIPKNNKDTIKKLLRESLISCDFSTFDIEDDHAYFIGLSSRSISEKKQHIFSNKLKSHFEYYRDDLSVSVNTDGKLYLCWNIDG